MRETGLYKDRYAVSIRDAVRAATGPTEQVKGAGYGWATGERWHEKVGYAVSIREASSRPSSCMETSRILNFWILPVTLMGNAETNMTCRGIL